jgi:hypothetical protein
MNTTTSKVILITAADAGYFQMARGAIESLNRFSQRSELSLGFFDLGCTSEQLAWLCGVVDYTVVPDWDFEFPDRATTPSYVRGFLVRPVLRRYFPGYETYIWLDADTWVQSWSALDLFITGARRKGMAIVPEIDRGSYHLYGEMPLIWHWVFDRYRENFGDLVARTYASFPILNAGAFAIQHDAPHWEPWTLHTDKALKHAGFKMTDQFALNLAIYGSGLLDKTEMLPAWCNWTCHIGYPILDEKNGFLVEPCLPNHPIGILHLTNRKEQRATIKTLEGRRVSLDLDYEGFYDGLLFRPLPDASAILPQIIGTVSPVARILLRQQALQAWISQPDEDNK